jgi:hypothetical protein
MPAINITHNQWELPCAQRLAGLQTIPAADNVGQHGTSCIINYKLFVTGSEFISPQGVVSYPAFDWFELADSIDGSSSLIYNADAQASSTPTTFKMRALLNGVTPIAVGHHRTNVGVGGEILQGWSHQGVFYNGNAAANQWGYLQGNEGVDWNYGVCEYNAAATMVYDPTSTGNPLNPNGPGSEINPFIGSNFAPEAEGEIGSSGRVSGSFPFMYFGFLSSPCQELHENLPEDVQGVYVQPGDTVTLDFYTPGGSLMWSHTTPPMAQPTICNCGDDNIEEEEPDTDTPGDPQTVTVYRCKEGILCEPIQVTPGQANLHYPTLAACEAACNPPAVLGCTDPGALNYNPNATQDNGTCEYQPQDDSVGGGITEINGICTVDTVTVDPCNMLEMASLWAQQVSTGTGCHETVLEELVLISALHDLTTRV